MKMEGEMISRDFIKPSSPTPLSQKTHKLSLLDQIVPPIYVPLVLYYPNSGNSPRSSPDFISQTTHSLKESLSSTLSHFYPLAGRIKDKLSIDCNDEGLLFLVLKFQGSLAEFLENPDPKVCREHIPSELKWTEPGPGDRVTMIQVSFFECGGFAIGSLFLHKVADGVTIGTFMKAWAAARARDSAELVLPSYKAMAFFPHNEALQRESHLFSAMRNYFRFGKTVMKRYVFDAPGISKLRAELGEGGLKQQRPTRVETVSAFLWKCFMIASARVNKSRAPGNVANPFSMVNKSRAAPGNVANRVSLVTHGVNMRRKANPPFPDSSFGNFVWLVPASSCNDESGRELKHLFGKVRTAIGKVDSGFVESMEDEEGFSGYCKNLEDAWNEFPETADYLAISSWCNFGLYSIDFGFGQPAWITKCDAGSDVEWPYINVLWLMDTPKGDGIEAWLTLEEQCFAEFDKIQEVYDFAWVDPSPMDIGSIGKC